MKTKEQALRDYISWLHRSIVPAPERKNIKLNSIQCGGYMTPAKPSIQFIAGSWTK